MARRAFRWGHGLAAMSLLFFTGLPVAAAPAVDVRARLGFDGWVVPGRITPLRLDIGTVREIDGTVTVTVPGPGGTPPTAYRQALRVIPGTRSHIQLEVIVHDPRRAITVEVREGRAALARVEMPVGVANVAEGIVAALTREAAGLEVLTSGPRRLRAAYVVESDLPSRWQAYDGVELLAIRDLNTRALLPAQQQALVEWVAQGGRLLVTPQASLVIPSWLRPLLPADVDSETRLRVPGIPVPLARLVAGPSASAVETNGVPLAVRGRYGRGVVEVWAFDAFAPEVRSWPGRLPPWRALLSMPPAVSVAQSSFAEELPHTRPLPGGIQMMLAVLSVAYIVGLRVAMRRWGASPGGWVLIGALVAAVSVMLYTVASGARAAASSIVQVSIVEMLPGVSHARVTTYLSLITPYGGALTLRLPRDAMVQPASGLVLLITEPAHTVMGGTPEGQAALEVVQVVPMSLRARAEMEQGALTLVVEHPGDGGLRDAVLYRGRQTYHLGRGPIVGRTRLDPARWEPVRPTAAGSDLTSRAWGWVLSRLGSVADGDTWLVGVIADDRLLIRLPNGRPGEAIQLLVLPLEVR